MVEHALNDSGRFHEILQGCCFRSLDNDRQRFMGALNNLIGRMERCNKQTLFEKVPLWHSHTHAPCSCHTNPSVARLITAASGSCKSTGRDNPSTASKATNCIVKTKRQRD